MPQVKGDVWESSLFCNANDWAIGVTELRAAPGHFHELWRSDHYEQ